MSELNSNAIGEVVKATGSAFIETADGLEPLKIGSEVFEDSVIITEDGGKVEIRFEDDTVFSQGENSRISLDDYVYDADQADNSGLLFNISEGAFRVVTGKIAAQNPEKFNVQSPLATIGIRGTDFMIISSADGDQVIAVEIDPTHVMIVSDQFGSIRIMNQSGTGVDLFQGQPIGTVQIVPQEVLQAIQTDHAITVYDSQGHEVIDQGQDDNDNGETDPEAEEAEGEEQAESGEGEAEGEVVAQGEGEGEGDGEAEGETNGDGQTAVVTASDSSSEHSNEAAVDAEGYTPAVDANDYSNTPIPTFTFTPPVVPVVTTTPPPQDSGPETPHDNSDPDDSPEPESGLMLDSDGDGIPDNQDAFPHDPTESLDTDGDGVGNNSDAFPEDPTEYLDTDGDGVGNNSDPFPEDPTNSIAPPEPEPEPELPLDSDGDGIPDDQDAFPVDPTEHLDTDSDGMGDNSDAFPEDPAQLATNGNDLINGSNLDDFQMGAGGNDTLLGNAGDDYLDGGTSDSGDEWLPVWEGRGQGDSFYGISFGDQEGSELTSDGNDYIDGGLGNDLLDGDYGNDTLLGGPGDDLLDGWAGNDSLEGGDGNDLLLGYQGQDTLRGGIGDDTLEGEHGNNLLFGDAGNDWIQGGDGNDTIVGGIGTDTLEGGLGDDTFVVWGSFEAGDYSGNDASGSPLSQGNPNSHLSFNEEISGGEGTADTLHVYGTADFTGVYVSNIERVVIHSDITIDISTFDPGGSISSISVVDDGQEHVLRFTGSGEADLSGITWEEGSAPFKLIIGPDITVIADSNALDQLTEIDGSGDLYLTDSDLESLLDNIFSPGSNISVQSPLDSDGDGIPDYQDAFPVDPTEHLDTDGDGAGDNSDAFPEDPTEYLDTDSDGAGNNSDVFPEDPTEYLDTDSDGVGDNSDAFPNDPAQLATHGNDLINGSNLDDLQMGAGGNDTLLGNAGDDYLDGGTSDSGDEWLPVWEGRGQGDSFYGISSGDQEGSELTSDGNDYIDGGLGNDLLDGDYGNDTLLGGPGDDLLDGWAGNDSLEGGDGNDHLLGYQGQDTLRGGIGDDTLEGEHGNNLLFGDAGNDWIQGGDGNDTIVGGIGIDTLEGGLGDDTFVVWGEFEAGAYSDNDASETPLSQGNPNTHLSFNESLHEVISGGDDNDTLHVYGNADFTGVTVAGIENLVIHSSLTVDIGTFDVNSDITTVTVVNDGNEHVIRFTGTGEADLTGITWGNGSAPFTLIIDQDVTVVADDALMANLAEIKLNGGKIEPAQGNEPLNFSGITLSGNVITGTAGADTLIGTAQNEIILGKGGADTIDGEGGDDYIDAGGIEAFSINGSAGNDTLLADDPSIDGVSNGESSLRGNEGTDTIFVDAHVSNTFADNFMNIQGGSAGDIIDVKLFVANNTNDVFYNQLNVYGDNFGEATTANDGNDTINIDLTFAQQETTAATSSYFDSNTIFVEGGGGSDDIELNLDVAMGLHYNSFTLLGEAGNDTLSLDLDVSGHQNSEDLYRLDLSMAGGTGDDTLELDIFASVASYVSNNSISMNGDAGKDTLTFRASFPATDNYGQYGNEFLFQGGNWSDTAADAIDAAMNIEGPANWNTFTFQNNGAGGETGNSISFALFGNALYGNDFSFTGGAGNDTIEMALQARSFSWNNIVMDGGHFAGEGDFGHDTLTFAAGGAAVFNPDQLAFFEQYRSPAAQNALIDSFQWNTVVMHGLGTGDGGPEGGEAHFTANVADIFRSNSVTMTGGEANDAMTLSVKVTNNTSTVAFQDNKLVMAGDSGNDTMTMELDYAAINTAGNFHTMHNNSFTMEGGNGNDQMRFTLTLSGSENDIEDNTFSFMGSDGSDTITATIDGNCCFESTNAIALNGGSGNDTLQLNIMAQYDIMNNFDGTYATTDGTVTGFGGGIALFGGSGDDILGLSLTASSIEGNGIFMTGSDGADTFSVTVNAANDFSYNSIEIDMGFAGSEGTGDTVTLQVNAGDDLMHNSFEVRGETHTGANSILLALDGQDEIKDNSVILEAGGGQGSDSISFLAGNADVTSHQTYVVEDFDHNEITLGTQSGTGDGADHLTFEANIVDEFDANIITLHGDGFGGTETDTDDVLSININVASNTSTNFSLDGFDANTFSLFGGSGNDTLSLNIDYNGTAGMHSNIATFSGGGGDDLMTFSLSVFGPATGDVSNNHVMFWGGTGSDTISVSLTDTHEVSSMLFFYAGTNEGGDSIQGLDADDSYLFVFERSGFTGNTPGSFTSTGGQIPSLASNDFISISATGADYGSANFVYLNNASNHTLFYDADGFNNTAHSLITIAQFTTDINITTNHIAFDLPVGELLG